jgi:glyoxylase I family protein
VQHIAFEVETFDQLVSAKANIEAEGVEVLGPTNHGIFQSIYFRDPNGHRLELAVNTQTPEEMAELRRVAHDMLDEWHQTRQAPRHAAWLHEKEFNPETV